MVPAALTFEGLPHAQRACAAWPLCSLLVGLILGRAQNQQWSAALTARNGDAVRGIVMSRPVFSGPLRYQLIAEQGMTCQSSTCQSSRTFVDAVVTNGR